MDESKGKTTVGLEPNVAGLLCYLVVWITGLIFLLLEKENKFVRFHAMQSIVTFGLLTIAGAVLGPIPFLGWGFRFIIGVISLVLWIVLMVKAYRGEKYKLPWVGNFAEKNS